METGLLPENKSRGSSSDDDAMGDEQAMEYDGRQPAASEAEPSAAAEQRCGCSDAKTIEVIAVGQNVLAVILARAWADLLFEVAMPIASGIPLHATTTCAFDLRCLAVILTLGALANQVCVGHCFVKGPIVSLMPAVVGMTTSGTVTPSALKCRDDGSNGDLLFALYYLAFALLLFATLNELKRRLTEPGDKNLARRYAVGITTLASNFLALSSAAILNATSKSELAFNAPEYLAAYTAGLVTEVRLPDPALCQAMWAMAAFLWLPRVLASLSPLLSQRPVFFDFAIKLFAFYVAFQILNAILTTIAVSQQTSVVVSSGDAPILEKAALAVSMALLAVMRALLPSSGQKVGLGAIAAPGPGVGIREATEMTREAFVEHTIGMSLGWSWHPFIKALFLGSCALLADAEARAHAEEAEEEEVEAGAVLLYTLAATVCAGRLYFWLWHLAAARRTREAEGAADAGFTADSADAGDGGDDGGGGE